MLIVRPNRRDGDKSSVSATTLRRLLGLCLSSLRLITTNRDACSSLYCLNGSHYLLMLLQGKRLQAKQ